jgi:hypothetical protein
LKSLLMMTSRSWEMYGIVGVHRELATLERSPRRHAHELGRGSRERETEPFQRIEALARRYECPHDIPDRAARERLARAPEYAGMGSTSSAPPCVDLLVVGPIERNEDASLRRRIRKLLFVGNTIAGAPEVMDRDRVEALPTEHVRDTLADVFVEEKSQPHAA